MALAWAIAVCVAYAAGHLAIESWPGTPLVAQDWLFMAVLPAALLAACISARSGTPAWLTWMLRAVIAFAAPPLLMQSYLRYTWSAGEAAAWIVGLGAVTLVVWASQSALERREPGPSLPISLLLVVFGIAITIMTSGSQSVGQLAFALATALGGVGLVSLFLPAKQPAMGSSAVVWPVAFAILMLGRFYASVTDLHLALLALAPLAAWLAEIGVIHKRRTIAAIVRVIAVAIPVGVVLTQAALRFAQKWNETPAPYSY